LVIDHTGVFIPIFGCDFDLIVVIAITFYSATAYDIWSHYSYRTTRGGVIMSYRFSRWRH